MQGKVIGWVQKSGFELELHIARSLASRSFIVSQSGVYGGPGPEEIVEVDIEGRLVKFELDDDAEARTLGIVTIVECKKAHLPWVLFSAPITKWTYSRPLNRHSDGLGAVVLATLGLGHSTRPDPTLLAPPRLGFSLRTALINGRKGNSRDHARLPREAKPSAEAAVSQIRREVLAWTAAHGVSEDEDPRYSGWILFPVVVLEGTLFECYQFEQPEPRVEPIDHGLLSLPAPSTGLAGLPVDIVTRDAFPLFLDSLLEFSNRTKKALHEFVKEENSRIKEEWKEAERERGQD